MAKLEIPEALLYQKLIWQDSSLGVPSGAYGHLHEQKEEFVYLIFYPAEDVHIYSGTVIKKFYCGYRRLEALLIPFTCTRLILPCSFRKQEVEA